MIRIVVVAGARPNFMKVAPLVDALNKYPDEFDQTLVHTGQHYDDHMSRSFFESLGLPEPDVHLHVGSGSHAEQTGRIMVEFERMLVENRPDLVVVVGDVNSTMACTITAKKLGIQVAHVEAGLRSRDMSMPEEINRLCTDVLCDYLFTTDVLAADNLRSEGADESRIFFVGNVMIDTLLKHREVAAHDDSLTKMGLVEGGYALLTLHRPSNVDDPDILRGLLETFVEIARTLPVVFPAHPRTREKIQVAGLANMMENGDMRLIEPLRYIPFVNLVMNARFVLTDSGGLQEETTVLGVPCLTVRHNTERPITCSQGTNYLVGTGRDRILAGVKDIMEGHTGKTTIPEKWDGQAAERIVAVLRKELNASSPDVRR